MSDVGSDETNQADQARKLSDKAYYRGILNVDHAESILKEEQKVAATDSGGGINLPNMAGIGGALDKLKFGLEARAKKFMERIEAIDTRSDAVFDRANQHVAGADRQLDQVNEYLDQVDKATGGNGGPLDVAPTT